MKKERKSKENRLLNVIVTMKIKQKKNENMKKSLNDEALRICKKINKKNY